MAIREYQFVTGIETSTSPDPATPSASSDAVTKGYTDAQYAQLSSWATKCADVTAIKAIASADRSNGQVVINYGTNALYKFNSSSSATGDDDTILTPSSGSGRWEKITSSSSISGVDAITLQLDTYDASITAGEAISACDAITLQIHNGSGSNVYKVFKADNDLSGRTNFSGFSKSSASVTPQITTYTISAAFVSGNSIPITINGRTYTTSYSSSSDATLQAVATAIATDPDVVSASVTVVGGNQTGTDDRVITVTSRGGLSLNITSTTVTGGASQPTITLSNTQTASGGSVDIVTNGILNGFSSLTVGSKYYLSSTAGSISLIPGDPEVYVGQAVTSTALFINPNNGHFNFGVTDIFLISHGSSSSSDANASAASYHFNYYTWSSGTAAGTALWNLNNNGSGLYNSNHYALNGINTSGTRQNLASSYNKSSWTTITAPGDTFNYTASHSYNGYIYRIRGDSGAGASNVVKKWNGSSWSTPSAFSESRFNTGAGNINNLLNAVAGSGAAGTTHETKNTLDTNSTATSYPGSNDPICGSGTSPSSKGVFGNVTASGATYTWDGTSWSSAINDTVVNDNSSIGPTQSFSISQNKTIKNGGYASAACVATTRTFNGTAWSSTTANSVARGGSCSSSF